MAEPFPCPCCGYRTLSEPPPGTFEVCPVCGWEDDNVQFHDPDFEGGANVLSLRQAQDNFIRLGASAFRRIRPPKPDEERDPDWRPTSEKREERP